MSIRLLFVTGATLFAMTQAQASSPRAINTQVLGPFTGHHAKLHPANADLQPTDYYGTDLGWSYEHQGRIQFLFGDTLTISGKTIGPSHDDAFGSIDLAAWPDGSRIAAGNIPLLELARRPGSRQLAALNPGSPLEGLKTPVAGFSNGAREFALFITAKPQQCRTDAQCSNGLTCDTSLGFAGEPPDKETGLTFACARSWPGCSNGTMQDSLKKTDSGSGFCSDRSSTLWADTEYGRVSSVGMQHIFGVRDANDPATYGQTRRWLTNKFINVATRTVADFDPSRTARAQQDYRSAHNAGGNRRVFLWGRPHFVGVNSRGATLGMYFAYADMPVAPEHAWTVHYFTGTDTRGLPRFSTEEREAVPVDLDSTQAGSQSVEIHDNVQHMSIVWVARLNKWVMLYGGGVSKFPIPTIAPNCGVLEVFARNECKNVVVGNGAIRLRTADDPWGPWTPPEDAFVGGDADARPISDQYAPGGVLYHSTCKGSTCQTRSTHLPVDDYGWLYGANIIEQWTQPAEGGGVDLIWNASTWDPYRVILLRTRIVPQAP